MQPHECQGVADFLSLRQAIENADRGMVVWRKTKDQKNAAETLNLVGSLAQRKGMTVGDYKLLEKAEESLKESLEIRENVLSRSDPALGQVLNTIGEFYLEQGVRTTISVYLLANANASFCFLLKILM